MTNIESLRQSLCSLRDSRDISTSNLLNILKDIPQKPESIPLFEMVFDLINRIEEPLARRNALLDLVKEIPLTGPFVPLYSTTMEAVIIAADDLKEGQYRINELLKIANELPKTEEFIPLRQHAWRLALGLPDKPRYKKPSLERIANELPKSSDYSFYRRFTLLGVAKELPKESVFLDLYREAMQLAIDAVAVIEEPYYRKYALLFIANELRTERFPDLYNKAVTDAYMASIAIKDPFAREHALIEVLRELPKTQEFSELLMDVVEQALNFFTMRKWMEDVEALEVVDYILSAEEPGIKDSKKRRYSRGKYSAILSKELDKLGSQLNDIRFIETLRPYTHVWIQPKDLRDSVRKVMAHLESLKEAFHGREIERPVFIKEVHPYSRRKINNRGAVQSDCISIDVGATNTVIMRKKGDAQPDFVVLSPISKRYDSAYSIPTILSAETDNIGTEVTDENPIANIKQMLFEGNPKGRAYMERFFRILYQHLKKVTATGGWFSLTSKNLVGIIYITVPIGFQSYRKAMKDIAKKIAKGVKIEFIEEPLAASIGYQVADDRDKVIMVIDFGGSTLNTMVVRVNIKEVHVIAKPDRAQIMGGRDIDLWLAEHLAKKIGLSTEGLPYGLLALAEVIKVGLSKSSEAPFEWDGSFVCNISRMELEGILDKHDFYREIDRTISNVLKKAEKVGMKKDKIEAVLLTGGSSQIPSFKDKIGHIFPALRVRNLIYDHSPLSAVALGAALYGTKDVTDRHLGMAYAIRYATGDKDLPYSYNIVLEKGEALPVERFYKMTPAKRLGVQREVSLELFEVPEGLITRRWMLESGMEFIKQELIASRDVALNGLKTITLPISEPLNNTVDVAFCVNETGELIVKYGSDGSTLETGIRLQ